MSLDDKTGDTEYFASTDYNQRLEEKAESQYEQKDVEVKPTGTVAENANIDILIESKDTLSLYRLANESLSESDYLKLIALGNKDIHIQLARNENITDTVAEQLIGTVYLAHKELLFNQSVSEASKAKLKEYLMGNPIYTSLLQEREEINA